MADQLSVQGSNDEPIDNEEASFEFDKEMFIEEVRKYRCLWDINSESYKNRLSSKMLGARLPPYLTKMVSV